MPQYAKKCDYFLSVSQQYCAIMLAPITAVGGVNSKIVCRDKDIFYLKENLVLHSSLPDLSRSIVLGPSHHPCSITSFDVAKNMLAVAYRTVAGPLVELHQLSPSHSATGASSQINSIGGIEVCDVAFCHDGSRLVILSSVPDFSVSVYDTATKECLHSINLVIPASRVCFSPINSSRALVYGSGIAQVIDFSASPPSIFRCEFIDGQNPLTAHSACFDDAGRVFVATRAGFAVCFDPQSLQSSPNSTVSASGFVSAVVSAQRSAAFISSFRGAIVSAGEDNSLRVFDLGSEHRLPHVLFATVIAVPSDAVLCGGCCSNDAVVLQDSAGNLYAVDILALPAKPHEVATDGQSDVPPASRIASWRATGLAPRTPEFPPDSAPGETFVTTGVLQRNDVYTVTLIESGHSACITAAASIYLDSGEPSSTLVSVSDDCTARAWDNASAAAPMSVFRESSNPSAFTCCVSSPTLPGHVVVADASGRVSVLGIAGDARSLMRSQAARVAQAAIKALAVTRSDGSIIVAAAVACSVVLLEITRSADCFQLITSVSMGNRDVVALALHGRHVYAASSANSGRQSELVIFKLPTAASPTTPVDSLSPLVKSLPGVPSSLLVKDHGSDMSLSAVTVSCNRDLVSMHVPLAAVSAVPAPEAENAEDAAGSADQLASAPFYTHQRRRIASAPLQYSVYGNSMLSACDDGFVVVHKDSQAHALAVANSFDGGCTAVAAAGKYVYAGTARGCLLSFSSPLLPPSSSAPPASKLPSNPIVISDSSIVEEAIDAWNKLQIKSSQSAKSDTLAKVGFIKEKLHALLADNSAAPPDEQLSRFEFVVDVDMQLQLDAESSSRVSAAQTEIKKQNLTTDLLRDRIMDATWGTLNDQALVLSALSKQLQVSTFPVCKPSSEFEKQSSLVSYYRNVELAEFSLLRSANVQVSNVHTELHAAFPGSVWCDDRPKHSILDIKSLNTAPLPPRGPDTSSASSPGVSSSPFNETGGSYLGEDDEHADDPRAKKLSWGGTQLLYPRFDVTSRERRITQALLLLDEALSRRTAFNVAWKEFQSKKRAAVAKIEERNGRILEIIEELKTSDEAVKFNDGSGEEPLTKLQVKDSELKSEIIKSGEEGKVADAGDRSKDGKMDEASERALQDMMGGKLEGGRDVKLLERVIDPPAWYVEGMAEMSDERAKEFKEWQAQQKALDLEKEKYRKTLDTELKKLRSEAVTVIDSFDESLGALSDLRMGHNSAAYELELLAERCAVLVHAEESAIAAIESTQAALPELQATHAKLSELCRIHDITAAEDERAANSLATEEKALDRKLRKELNDQAPIVAEPLLSILKQVGASFAAQPVGSVPMPSMIAEAPPNHVDAGIWNWFIAEVSSRQKVWNRWLHAHEIARTSALQAAEFHDRFHVATQELELAQQRLQRLQLQLELLAVDLDVVLILKQGQIEVEESPVVTDMSDAVLVSRPTIQYQNERILHQGAVMNSLLRDTMKLQSGIQRFRWDAEELDMREEDVTSRIRHFQLLRVTKDLQLRISGAETKSNVDNVASLEKQLGNLHEVYQAKIAVIKKKLEKLDTSSSGFLRENSELEEDILALESSMAERDRLADLQGTASLNVRDQMSKLQSKRLSTHRRLLDLAKAQTREIELMREELVRLRAKTFPSFAQLRDSFMLD